MVTASALVGQADLRRQIYVKGEAVYSCDVCKRSIRVPSNKYSVDVIQRCIITKNCVGKLHKVLTTAAANDVSAIPPAVPNTEDWVQRRVFYLFEQTIKDTIWTVQHNLGNKPSVQVFTTQLQDGEEILVETDPLAVRVVDLNTVEIEFDSPQSGKAQCLAYASTNTVNPSVGTPTVVTQTTTLLTNSGELTIATIDASTLIDFQVRYRSVNAPDGYIDVQYVGVDDQPSVNSPWAGVNKVYVNGRAYTVRSFNIVTQPQAESVFSNKLIAEGTQFYFLDFSTTPNQNLILYGTSPFTVVDRVVDRYIDIALIDPDQPELVYTSGEAFAAPSVIKTVYPHILAVD